MKKFVPVIACFLMVCVFGIVPAFGTDASTAKSSAGSTSSQETTNVLNQLGDIYDKIGNIDDLKGQFGGIIESASNAIGDIGADDDDNNNDAQNDGTTYKSSGQSAAVTKFNYNSGSGSKNYTSAPKSNTDVSIAEGTNPFSEPSGVIDSSSDEKSIKWLQWYLNNLGYDMSAEGINGVYNKATENAVKKFQSSNGLEVTGKVDDATKSKLKHAYDSKQQNESKTSTNPSASAVTQATQTLAPAKAGMDTSKKVILIVLAVILVISAGVIVAVILKGTKDEAKHEVEYLDDSEFFGDNKEPDGNKSDNDQGNDNGNWIS